MVSILWPEKTPFWPKIEMLFKNYYSQLCYSVSGKSQNTIGSGNVRGFTVFRPTQPVSIKETLIVSLSGQNELRLIGNFGTDEENVSIDVAEKWPFGNSEKSYQPISKLETGHKCMWLTFYKNPWGTVTHTRQVHAQYIVHLLIMKLKVRVKNRIVHFLFEKSVTLYKNILILDLFGSHILDDFIFCIIK